MVIEMAIVLYIYVVFPCDFGDPRVCPDITLHVDVVSFFDGGNLQFAAQLQMDDGNIYVFICFSYRG